MSPTAPPDRMCGPSGLISVTLCCHSFFLDLLMIFLFCIVSLMLQPGEMEKKTKTKSGWLLEDVRRSASTRISMLKKRI